MTETHTAQYRRSALPGIEAVVLASNQSFPRHAHDHYGIGLIHAGAQRSWSGIGPVEAGPGDVITVNPGEMHDGSPVRGLVRSWRMLYIDADLVEDTLRDVVPGVAEITRPALRDPLLATHFTRLFASVTAPVALRLADPLAAEVDLVRTLTCLLSRYGRHRRPALVAPPCVSLALERLDDAPERPVTLAELAALSGVSRFQLLRGFARTTGTTPHAYRLQRRVRLARRLLAAGEPPAAAAAEAGFADQSHLTRAFRRQFGATPSRYRAAMS